MVLVVNDFNADDYALVWNGSTWGNALSLDTSGTAESDQSALFVAYEQQSGRAMVVYGKDGDVDSYYRIWNGSSWELGEGTITAPAGVTLQSGWIRLASDPQSNRIVLGVLTDGGTGADIWLNVWDGSSWEPLYWRRPLPPVPYFPMWRWPLKVNRVRHWRLTAKMVKTSFVTVPGAAEADGRVNRQTAPTSVPCPIRCSLTTIHSQTILC